MKRFSFSKFFASRWKPRKGIVYKSWHKGDSHFGKEATVTILLDDKEYKGTFNVQNDSCEIRIGEGIWKWSLNRGDLKLHNVRKLVTPVENVLFKKEVKHIDSISTRGQNGYVGTEIRYTAKILDSKLISDVVSSQ
jgi:hypothetical protein